MVYAIVRAGGRQEKVSVGDLVTLDRVAGEPGSTIELPVLLLVMPSEVAELRAGTPLPPVYRALVVDPTSLPLPAEVALPLLERPSWLVPFVLGALLLLLYGLLAARRRRRPVDA